jgi:hypothetical protein
MFSNVVKKKGTIRRDSTMILLISGNDCLNSQTIRWREHQNLYLEHHFLKSKHDECWQQMNYKKASRRNHLNQCFTFPNVTRFSKKRQSAVLLS